MKKTKKRIESKKSETFSQNEMKRYLGALSETHNEHLKAINENFIIVNRKLDSHSEMIGSLLEDMTIVKNNIKVLKEVDYYSLIKRVSKLESKTI